jgi:hypothetical protein
LSGLYQGDGSFEGRDVNNLPTASFSASSLALGLQLAQAVGDAVSVGLGAKYASERLGDVSGGGVTFDAGVRVQAGPVGFGAAAQNAFGKMSYSGALYDFPTSYGLGVSYQIPTSGLTVALDANMPSAYFNDVRGGLEWRYHDRLALRGGYRKELGAGDGEPLGGPTFGMGAGANGFWFDYGFLTGGASGSGQHRMSLTYHPGFMNAGVSVAPSTKPRTSRDETAKSKEAKSKPVAATRPKASPNPNVASKPASSNATSPNSTAAVKSTVTIPAAPAPTVATKPAPTSPPNVAPAENSPRTTQAVRTPVPPMVAAPAPIKSSVPATSAPSAPVAPKPPMPSAPTAVKPAPAPPTNPAPANPAPSTPPAAEPAPQKPASVQPPASAPAPAVPAPPAETAPAKTAPVEAAPVKPAVEEKPAPPPVAAPAPREEKPAPPPAPAKAEPRPARIKVKSGETLETIAKRWGTTVPAMMMENDLVSETVKPGQTLKLPPPTKR